MCLLLCIFFIGILSADSADSKELIFTTQDFKPFSYLEDGVVSGPATDIIKATCKKIGVKPVFKLYPWPRAQAMVKDGRAHGMFVIGWNEQREKWLHFSLPILDTEYGFFVLKMNLLQFQSIEDLNHYTIGVFGPSNTSKSLERIQRQNPTIKIDMTPDDEACFKKLAVGRVHAVYSNKDVGMTWIKTLNFENLRYAGSHRKLKYYIGFSKEFNDPELVEQFNQAYLSLHNQGHVKKILKRYNMAPSQLE